MALQRAANALVSAQRALVPLAVGVRLIFEQLRAPRGTDDSSSSSGAVPPSLAFDCGSAATATGNRLERQWEHTGGLGNDETEGRADDADSDAQTSDGGSSSSRRGGLLDHVARGSLGAFARQRLADLELLRGGDGIWFAVPKRKVGHAGGDGYLAGNLELYAC